MAVPLLSQIPWNFHNANAMTEEILQVPENIQRDLTRLFGKQAEKIVSTNKIKLKAPEIAENGSVVPVTVEGDKRYVLSAALFVDKNPKPLTCQFILHEGSDLPVSTRIKVGHNVKVTIGCGGV
jgi:sulfur-oxidizing protein SoxY